MGAEPPGVLFLGISPTTTLKGLPVLKARRKLNNHINNFGKNIVLGARR